MKPETYTHTLKPALDFIISIMVLILFSWLIVLIVLSYMLTLQFPIFFKQPRLGKNGKVFQMWKFRTLSVDDTKTLQKRRFILGDMLRKTNLDELPQLWNILKGEMSWVGPRPLPLEYDNLFSSEQRKRFMMKPGITGWAQVNGRHSIAWKEKLALDQYYVKNVSLMLDIRIIFKTAGLMLSFKKDRSLEEEKFTGAN
ncbi:MAG: sugar transferase [Cyclobacteriaceae bacterium]